MLFWADDDGAGAVHHVALYLGGDQMVEAPGVGQERADRPGAVRRARSSRRSPGWCSREVHDAHTGRRSCLVTGQVACRSGRHTSGRGPWRRASNRWGPTPGAGSRGGTPMSEPTDAGTTGTPRRRRTTPSSSSARCSRSSGSSSARTGSSSGCSSGCWPRATCCSRACPAWPRPSRWRPSPGWSAAPSRASSSRPTWCPPTSSARASTARAASSSTSSSGPWCRTSCSPTRSTARPRRCSRRCSR